ncbi:FtsX-like permease family protein [Listeria sp. FSL L7-1510]|uniref:ABC transporter permease n=1 Tax=Listeria immobilis TaxID=2713502 RepID=UPI0016297C51|nr:ABC transporter permease [Listeria immobilis]MBC1514961.1 FtsX-like permease family protein [Listeria immobilis]
MLENIKLSLQSIWAHKLRSILTMLGVIIGLAAIIAIVSLIQSSSEALKKEIVGGANNSLELSFAPEAEFSGAGGEGYTGEERPPEYMTEISQEKIDEMKNIPGMKNVVVSYNSWGSVFRENISSEVDIRAVNSDYFHLNTMKITTGRGFNQSDYASGSQGIVLNQFAYDTLFPEGDGIGKIIEYAGYPFRIIGVMEPTGDTAKEWSMMYGEEEMGAAYVTTKNWPLIQESINPSPTVMIQTEKTDDLQRIAEEAAALLNADLPESDFIYGVYNMGNIDEEIEEFNKAQFYLLGGIASISLLVGGIGVMNIMLVSVTERTREIGIKKALGARRGTILWQFLVEAMVLTLLGGCIGIGLGIGIGVGLTNMAGYPYIISIPAILGGLSFSILIGVIFGIVPAIKASKLDPIEALRYE